MNCSFCAAAGEANVPPEIMAAANISLLRIMIVLLVEPGFLRTGYCCRGLSFLANDRRSALRSPASCALTVPSVGKRPKSELLLANRYEPGKPMWLLDEKVADQRSKD